MIHALVHHLLHLLPHSLQTHPLPQDHLVNLVLVQLGNLLHSTVEYTHHPLMYFLIHYWLEMHHIIILCKNHVTIALPELFV